MGLTYLSVCSGIEAATVAWHPLGWTPVGFSEIDRFPCDLLNHHYPHVPNFGDLTQHRNWPDLHPDILVGGTPCQSFSVAGLRKGLEDPRGNLTLVFLGVLERQRPRWVVWENVPGVLSDRTGAFEAFLQGLAQLGYGTAYRVLDAQHFGVAQRRRRVFVVGYLGDWRRAAAVLFEPESLCGNPPTRGKARQGVAGTLASRPGAGVGLGTDFELGGGLVPTMASGSVSPTIDAAVDRKTGQGVAGALVSCFGGNRTSGPLDVATAVSAHGGPHGRMDFASETFVSVSLPILTLVVRGRDGGCNLETDDSGVAHALRAPNGGRAGVGVGAVAVPGTAHYGVRRLTPTECERLQGFPDGYTKIFHRTADGPRYKALGNSMAVPVMRWIGERIQKADLLV